MKNEQLKKYNELMYEMLSFDSNMAKEEMHSLASQFEDKCDDLKQRLATEGKLKQKAKEEICVLKSELEEKTEEEKKLAKEKKDLENRLNSGTLRREKVETEIGTLKSTLKAKGKDNCALKQKLASDKQSATEKSASSSPTLQKLVVC